MATDPIAHGRESDPVPVVTVQAQVRAPVDAVWARVVDVAAYPERMASVRRIAILESAVRDGQDESVVGWETEVEDGILRWVELEIRDPVARRVQFDQLSGDLKIFRGHWQVDPIDEQTTAVELVVEFEIGLDLLREVLNPYASEVIERNSREMLRALEREHPGDSRSSMRSPDEDLSG